ncbi:hypothetical protein O9993_08365 [Vibrio lentus]|nr:hypothetical protein [Vibrio lentus]
MKGIIMQISQKRASVSESDLDASRSSNRLKQTSKRVSLCRSTPLTKRRRRGFTSLGNVRQRLSTSGYRDKTSSAII